MENFQRIIFKNLVMGITVNIQIIGRQFWISLMQNTYSWKLLFVYNSLLKDQRTTGLHAKDETTVQNLFCPFSFVYSSLQVETSNMLFSNFKFTSKQRENVNLQPFFVFRFMYIHVLFKSFVEIQIELKVVFIVFIYTTITVYQRQKIKRNLKIFIFKEF